MAKIIAFVGKIFTFFQGTKKWILFGAFVALFVLFAVLNVSLPENWWIPAVSAFVAGVRVILQEVKSKNTGWKTYAAFIAIFAVWIMQTLGLSLPVSYDQIYAILGGFQVVGVGDAVQKMKVLLSG